MNVRSGRAPAYGAAGVAFAFAAVSAYWGLGGSLGVDTLGGRIEALARAHDPGLLALTWVAAVLKAAGGLLALALVQSWGGRFPRRLLLLLAWGGAAVLVLYGGAQVAIEALVELHVLHLAGTVDWYALRWHLALWDLWFLAWGLLLALAAAIYTRSATGARAPGPASGPAGPAPTGRRAAPRP